MIRPVCVLTIAGLFLTAATFDVRAEAAHYHVVQNVPISGDGGWDYVTCDSASRRLYISHNTQVQILNVDTMKLVGKIEGTQGVHGIALAPDLGRGYISDGRNNRVMIFDLKTAKLLGVVKAGENPDAITYDPATRQVFAFNGRSQTVTIIKGAAAEVAATLPLDGKPEFAVADGQGGVYVNLEDKSQLLRINSLTLKVEQRWPLAPCEEPSSLAMDRATHRLFAGCGNKVMAVVNSADGKVITTLPIGDHVDATVFDPATKLIMNSNGEGTLTVIQEESPDHYRVVDTVPTQRGARTLALDETSHRLFLPTAQFAPSPASTVERPHSRPAIMPETFGILVVAPS